MLTALDSFVSDPQYAKAVRLLAQRGSARRFRKGTILIHEGDTGDTLYIVLAGRIKVYCMDTHDREITFGVFGPGEYVGEMSLDGGPRSASVITLEPSVCAVVTRHALREFLGEYPDFAFDLLSRVIQRLRLATRDARNLAFIDVYGRLTGLLNQLAVARPDGKRWIAERITHQEIASRVGCSREMVSRILKDLSNGGYITLEERRIVLIGKFPPRW